MNEQNQWYVTIEGNAVGPVSTDLVVRGIKHKKIATNAYVCVVGASEWQSLIDVAEFHAALSEGGLLDAAAPRNGHPVDDDTLENSVASKPADTLVETQPPLKDADDGEESDTTASFSSRRPLELTASVNQEPIEAHELQPSEQEPIEAHELQPSEQEPIEAHELQPSGLEPRNGKHAEVKLEGRPRFPSVDFDIDITVDDSHETSIDWGRGFSAYFLVGADVELPDEHALLHSLTTESRETFIHDEAMWNLALCLAFGSDAVASAAAAVFFDVVTAHDLLDRIEWMSRTLLSRGFMPSGIPHEAGYRGLAHLQNVCPPGLQTNLEREIAS
jgi:hypothetical protein